MLHYGLNTSELCIPPLKFKVSINIGGSFTDQNSNFKTENNGLYWLHFLKFSNLPGNINYVMYDDSANALTRIIDNKNNSALYISQSDLRNLQKQNSLQMMFQCDSSNTIGSIVMFLVWEGFNIDKITVMPPIAFNVVRQYGVWAANSQETVFPFDNVLVNSGKCWNGSANMFMAPVKGVYIFSFSATIKYGSINALLMIDKMTTPSLGPKKGLSQIPLCSAYLTKPNGDDISISGSAVVMMLAKDFAFVYNSISINYIEMSFKGFLYSPPNSLFIAWSARLDLIDATKNEFPVDNQGNIIFSDIVLNIGNVFRSNDISKVVLPIDGIYYITQKISQSVPIGAITNLVNGVVQDGITINSQDNNMTFEVSEMKNYSAGDSLSFRISLPTGFPASVCYALYFTGFLIFPL